MPSVRGRERPIVAGVLVAAGTASGALVGLVTAIAAAAALGGRSAPTAVLFGLVGAGLFLDGTALVTEGPQPPTYGRQVPREWGRFFGPRLVAALYGARLGVGPLTILSTWTWWSVTVAAALVGPLAAVVAGAWFASFRLVVTVGVSIWSSRGETGGSERHQQWFARLRAAKRANWMTITGAGCVTLVAAAALAGCGAAEPDAEAVVPRSERAVGAQEPVVEPPPVAATAAAPVEPPVGSVPDGGRAPLVNTVELEDVVRTSIPEQPSTGTIAAAGPTRSSDPEAMAEAVVTAIDGFEPVTEPGADRYLDLVAASEIQPDPTEEVALLETRGFEGGWTRAFRSRTNDVAVVSVYQFRDEAEAEFYLEDGLITIGGYGGRFFDIEDQPGVRGFVQYFDELDEDGTSESLVSLGAAFQTGNRWYLVYLVGSTETVTPEVLVPAVKAQRDLAAGRDRLSAPVEQLVQSPS